jgi:hypothetical protein
VFLVDALPGAVAFPLEAADDVFPQPLEPAPYRSRPALDQYSERTVRSGPTASFQRSTPATSGPVRPWAARSVGARSTPEVTPSRDSLPGSPAPRKTVGTSTSSGQTGSPWP